MKKLLSLLLLLLLCFLPQALAEEHTLDVVSITIDPDALWNKQTGIFTEGDRIIKRYGTPFMNAVYHTVMDVQHPAVMTYQPASGAAPHTEDILLELHNGPLDIDAAQKSLCLYATDGMLDYPLFDDPACTGYTGVVLSNGSNDGLFTRLAHGYQTEMVNTLLDADILLPATKPVIVYINGEYWGQYNLLENLDAYAVCRYTGLDTARVGEIDMIGSTGNALSGNSQAFAELMTTLSPTAEDQLITTEMQQYLKAHVDINSCLDWLAVTMYLGDQSPSAIRYYRLPDGKWHCAHSTYEWGLFTASANTPASYLKETGFTFYTDNLIFRRILEIDEYRDLFLIKLGKVYQTLTVEAMQQSLDAYAALLRPEMTSHYERWAPYHEVSLNYQWPTEPAAALAYWEARIQRMRDFTIVKRPYYIYTYTQEYFGLTDAEMLHYFGSPVPEMPADTVWTPPAA